MTREELLKEIKSVEIELIEQETEEIKASIKYGNAKSRLYTIKNNEQLENLKVEINRLRKQWGSTVSMVNCIKLELERLNDEYNYLQFADSQKR